MWPLQSSLCVFDGRLGHGVLDSAAAAPRVTMLINWWTYQPQVCLPISEQRLSKTQDARTWLDARGVCSVHPLFCRWCKILSLSLRRPFMFPRARGSWGRTIQSMMRQRSISCNTCQSAALWMMHANPPRGPALEQRPRKSQGVVRLPWLLSDCHRQRSNKQSW